MTVVDTKTFSSFMSGPQRKKTKYDYFHATHQCNIYERDWAERSGKLRDQLQFPHLLSFLL